MTPSLLITIFLPICNCSELFDYFRTHTHYICIWHMEKSVHGGVLVGLSAGGASKLLLLLLLMPRYISSPAVASVICAHRQQQLWLGGLSMQKLYGEDGNAMLTSGAEDKRHTLLLLLLLLLTPCYSTADEAAATLVGVTEPCCLHWGCSDGHM